MHKGTYAKVCLEIEQLVKQRVIPGISYAFCEGATRTLHYAGTYGFQDPFLQPIQQTTLYDVASLTKVMATTTRILQLIDQGRLAFTTPVHTVLPIQNKTLTIAHLLLHTSGYPADIENKYELCETSIRQAILQQECMYEPGRTSLYSDINFLLLGMIMEAIDQCDLETTCRQHIFSVLQMSQTSFICQNSLQVLPYEERLLNTRGQVQDYKARMMGQAGSAGLFTTLADSTRFMCAYLTRDRRLFSETMNTWLMAQNVYDRTYGWSKEYGDSTLYHTGFTGTAMYLDMKRKKGLILFTNRTHPNRENTAYIEARKQIIKHYQKEIL